MADRAFLTGINDYETIGDLRGCVNDTRSLKKLLVDHFGFRKSSIRVRTDTQVTKKELRKGWKWLTSDATPGDRLVFHFSGHGSYIADLDQDEPDHADELLCLYGMDWSDPDSYLPDDELREWTREIPDGISVTFVLDCCHSGTGTRMVPPPTSRASAADFRQRSSLVDLGSSRSRVSRVSKQTRSAAAEDEATMLGQILPSSSDELDEASVLARFAPPPPEVDEAVNQAKTRHGFQRLAMEMATRSDDDATPAMNHVLWSGSRSDQTSADAYIDGDYHGAFTYYFCKTVRSAPSRPASRQVIGRLRQTLRENGFGQVPQLEPSDTETVVFQVDRRAEQEEEVSSAPHGSEMPSPISGPASGEWNELLGALHQLVELLSRNLRAEGVPASETRRGLVYVHGICHHPQGYSEPWWQAMMPHLDPAVRQTLASNRHEILWNQHVSPSERSLAATVDPLQQRDVEQRLRDVLQERATREVSQQIERAAAVQGVGLRTTEPWAAEITGPIPRELFGIPGADCVDDFAKYLSNERIRSNVLNEFIGVVRPMLARGESIEVISHSWGAVVAFEALHQLDAEGLPGRVHTWFTVGAALAISFVADRLRPGDGRKPSVVERWINLDSRGDIVGGSLQVVGMQVDSEYLSLVPVGCRTIGPFVAPACAHSSYFDPSNLAVSRDIFARMICR